MAKLGNICKIVSGTTPKTNVTEYWNGTLNWITPAELSDTTDIVFSTERKITEKAVKESNLTPLPPGTVLLSSRAPIGKVAITGSEMYCNQGFKNLICSPLIYNKYLFWFLRSKTEMLNSLGRGATFKEISKSIVEEIEIPLPPIKDQYQISDKFEKLTFLINSRKKQLEKFDELVKSPFFQQGISLLRT